MKCSGAVLSKKANPTRCNTLSRMESIQCSIWAMLLFPRIRRKKEVNLTSPYRWKKPERIWKISQSPSLLLKDKRCSHWTSTWMCLKTLLFLALAKMPKKLTIYQTDDVASSSLGLVSLIPHSNIHVGWVVALSSTNNRKCYQNCQTHSIVGPLRFSENAIHQ